MGITSGSTEFFPIPQIIKKENETRQGSFISKADSIHPSAENIISNGGGNAVGEECREINILNSSGCSVTSGVVGVNLFACSGLTIIESNVIYIKNVKQVGADTAFKYREETSDGTTMNIVDGTVVLIGESVTSIVLPTAEGHNKIYNIKNEQLINATVNRGGSDTIEGSSDPILLNQDENVTLQSNGGANYIIK